MAILDAPTFAFDQRLFSLWNPSGRPDTDFVWPNPLYHSYLGFAYTPDGVGGAGQARYWNFLGHSPDHPEGIGYGTVIDLVGIWEDPNTVDFSLLTTTSPNANDDQMLWRLTGGGRTIFEFIVAAASQDSNDDQSYLANALIFSDTFNLSGQNDYAIGWEGNDTMNGGGGNDSLMGHFGADLLTGGSGNDVFLYEAATHSTLSNMDTITDYESGDSIQLVGSAGLISSFTLYQGSIADTVSAIRGSSNPSDSVYFFFDNTDPDNTAWYVYVKGSRTGASFDGTLIKIVSNSATAPFVVGVPVLTSASSYTLLTGQQDVRYIGNSTFDGMGNALDNVMIGGAGADTLTGLVGNDVLNGMDEADRLVGGMGDDTYTYTVDDTIVELENEGTDTILVANQGFTLPEYVENLTLTENTTALPISLNGNDEDNTIIGTENREVLVGRYGDDTLYGGGGDDTLSGWEGSNSIVAGDGDDVITLDSGRGTVLAGEGSDSIIYRSGEYQIYGDNGTDTLSFQVSSVRTLKVNLEKFTLEVYANFFYNQYSPIYEIENVTGARLAHNYIQGNELNNVLIGGDFNDSILGGRGNDILHGGLGNDVVAGGLGNDLMYEGLGDDVYRVDNTNDLVMVRPNAQEGGLDKIEAWSSYNLNWSDAQIENLTLTGNRENYAVGNALDNQIVGNTSHNLLQGLAGRDTITGGDGNDTLEGGLGGDVLRGGAGRDVFRISSREDSRFGPGLLDRLLDFNLREDSIEFVGMNGIESAAIVTNFFASVEKGISTIIEDRSYDNKKVVFFAFDNNGAEGIYLYVNGAGTGTDYDGSLLRYSPMLYGVASDGYLSGALVWIDTDDNGVRDWTDGNGNGLWEEGEGESWTLTDGQGRYTGLEGSGTLRVSANPNGTTIDISTGAVFTGSYAAPSDSQVISPLTSLLVASGDQQILKDAFGLGSLDVDLTSFDPLAAATAADGYSDADAVIAVYIQSVNAQIANILAVATSMMTAAGANASSASTIANAIAQNLATVAQAGPVDLSSTTVISNAIAAGSVGVLTDSQRVAFNAQLGSVSRAMNLINETIQIVSSAAIEDAENNIAVDVTEVLRDVIAAQIVAQQTLATQAANAVSSNNGALLTVGAVQLTQLLIEATAEVGQILTPGASHRYEASIDDIQAAGLSADGSILVLKFASTELVFLPIDSAGFSLAGVSYTPQEIIDQFALRPAFTYFVNNTTAYLLPELFAGDASLGLLYQWIDTSADAVLVGSNFADFIVLQGTGNKAVNGAGGADVIDGGTGSTFVSGGSAGDADTFFLDGRAPGVSWSTITDFELGSDKVTIWGWKEGVSRASVLFNDVDTGGATGYTGLTLHFENLLPDNAAAGSTNANFNSITLTGLSLVDFGASSIEELNTQIANDLNSHFIVGQTVDAYGEHGYLFIS
jgi:Ca2+-binding RTX toxin-like protein